MEVPPLSKNKSYWFGEGRSKNEKILNVTDIENAQKCIATMGKKLMSTTFGISRSNAKNLVEKNISTILDKLKLKSKPLDIVIFGSWRWDTQKKESDIDFLLLVEDKTITKYSSSIFIKGGLKFDVTIESTSEFIANLSEMKPFEVLCVVTQPSDLRFEYTYLRNLKFVLDKKKLAANVLETVKKDRMRMRKAKNSKNDAQYCKTLLASCRLLDVTCQILHGKTVSFRSFHDDKSSHLSHHNRDMIRTYLRCFDQMCSKLEVYAPSKIEKKYPSTPHFPFSPCSLDEDDVVSNHVSNFIGTDQVVVLEKLDGANCCITHNGEVFARTHSKVTSLPWFSTIKSMVRSFDTRLMDMLREKNLVLFGENMTAIHSITYDGLRSYFYLFGVLNRRRGMWLSWSKVTHIAKLLGIPTVPLVCGPKCFTGLDELKTLLQREASQASRLSGPDSDQRPEGFVVRHSGAFPAEQFSKHIAKYVRKNHIQTPASRHAFKAQWKKSKLFYD